MLVGYPHLCLGVHQKLNVEAKKKSVGWFILVLCLFSIKTKKKKQPNGLGGLKRL